MDYVYFMVLRKESIELSCFQQSEIILSFGYSMSRFTFYGMGTNNHYMWTETPFVLSLLEKYLMNIITCEVICQPLSFFMCYGARSVSISDLSRICPQYSLDTRRHVRIFLPLH